MSLFFARRRTESRGLYQDLFASGGDVSSSGDGFSLIPLFAAWRFIIDQFSSTPLHSYRSSNEGEIRAAKQPPLFVEPGPNLTPFAWKAQMVTSALSRGNAVGYMTAFGSDGWPSQIAWLDPTRVTIEDDALLPEAYWFDGKRLDPERVIHVPWIVPPGKRKGLSPLATFKAAFETGSSAQSMMRDWYKNGGFPSAHMKSVNAITPDKAQEVKATTKAAISGRDILVTGNDWDFAAIGIPADEARFIESLRLSATQIASIYGIPPEKIGGEKAASSLTYSTVLMDQLAVQVEVMRPWFSRFEEAFTLRALPRPLSAKFNMDATLRADPLTRAQTHEVNLRTGMETDDEGRRLENRPTRTPEEKAEWLSAWRGIRPEQMAARAIEGEANDR